ncbi:branched-chain amino acid aminotransferase [Corynebacterium evansiae]
MTTPEANSQTQKAQQSSQVEFSVTRTQNPVTDEKIAEILAAPGFGKYFTDHMVAIDWNAEEGWHNARVEPYQQIQMDPASSVFHYGQAIFEGLKAYRGEGGKIVTFRPEQNARRFQNSAARMAMPELPEELFLESLRQIVDIDQRWVPQGGGEESLYLRPFMISREVGLGVHPASSYTFFVIASPAGAYFSGGINPVSVWLSTEYTRAAPGGTGAAKFAGNYAASLAAQASAEKEGCDQVVWLDANEHKYIEEMGGMNLAFVFGSEDGGEGETAGAGAENVTLVTPELSGSLLPGVTRLSLLELARDLGYKVEERRISTDEWKEAAQSGAMTEAFACGTAAVVTPVGTVKDESGEFQVNGGQTGPVTMRLREQLTGIQNGRVADKHGWLYTLVEQAATA